MKVLRSKMSVSNVVATEGAATAPSPLVGAATPSGGGAVPKQQQQLNVNVALATNHHLLAVEGAAGATTPHTPEILASLIAMTNPLDDYGGAGGGGAPYHVGAHHHHHGDGKGALRGGSGFDSNSNSSASPLGSPATSTTPSIQKTCSQLIKAGLKLSIESKRKLSGSDSTDGSLCHKRFKKEEVSDDEYGDGYHNHRVEMLTPEDEERRRRRRERNKIAATKCRLKKRERTVNLVTESEVLETENESLKTQIRDLKSQQSQLEIVLSRHLTTCVKSATAGGGGGRLSPTSAYSLPIPTATPYDASPSYANGGGAPYDSASNSPYIRPESANVLASSYNCNAPTLQQYDQQPGQPSSTEAYIDGTAAYNPEYEQMGQYDGQQESGGGGGYQFQANQGAVQQCHAVQQQQSGRRNKFRNAVGGMDNGCLA